MFGCKIRIILGILTIILWMRWKNNMPIIWCSTSACNSFDFTFTIISWSNWGISSHTANKMLLVPVDLLIEACLDWFWARIDISLSCWWLLRCTHFMSSRSSFWLLLLIAFLTRTRRAQYLRTLCILNESVFVRTCLIA